MTSELKATPPVVAVLVSNGVEAARARVLESLRQQNYKNLQVLVLSSDPDVVKETIAGVLPKASLSEVAEERSFGGAANRAGELVSGAAFYLFLRDDTALAEDAVSRLVDQALESNAAVLGPKIVNWNDESRILSMGYLVDAFGVESAFVEAGELDQQQHDRVREAFTVSGEVVLIRTDLFETIGGFDERLEGFTQYLDFCWRAQIAGARVLVVPAAVAYSLHDESHTVGESDRRNTLKGRQHVVAKCYGWVYLLPVLAGSLLLAILELGYSVLTLRFSHARDVVMSWVSTVLRVGTLWKARRQVASTRQIRDREIRRRQAPGSTRLKSFLQGQIGGDVALRAISGRAGHHMAGIFAPGERRKAAIFWCLLMTVIAFGTRHLLSQGVPAYGQFGVFPDANSMLSQYWSGWREVGVGISGIGPAGVGLLGLASWVLFGSTELLRDLLILGLLPVGLIGMWRLLTPIDSIWGRVVGTTLYATLPLPYNALLQGEWGILLLLAATPFVMHRIARAYRVSPYGGHSRSIFGEIVSLGLLLALVSAYEPLILMFPLVAGLVLALTCFGGAAVRSAARGSAVVLGAVMLSLLMHLPWLAVLGESDVALHHFLVRSSAQEPIAASELLRFLPGAFGDSWILWCPLFVPVLPLLVGREKRLKLAVIAGLITVAGFGLCWTSGRGWLGDLLGREVSLGSGPLVFAAVGLCWSAGMAPSVFKRDAFLAPSIVRRTAALVSCASLLAAACFLLYESADGRWGAPTNDLRVALSLLDDRDVGPSYRVLWLGAPEVLPLRGTPVGTGNLHMGTSVRGYPDIGHQWHSAPTHAYQQLENAVEIGLSGNTTRMGRLLAPFGIRYVALVKRSTPSFSAGVAAPVEPRVRQALGSQLDLRPLATDPSVVVLLNESWMSSRSQFSEPVRLVGLDEPGELVVTDLSTGIPVLNDRRSSREQRGFVGRGEVLVSESFDANWRLFVDGQNVAPELSFGWAMRFESPSEGPAALWHSRPDSVADRAVIQIVLWLVVAQLALSERRRQRSIAGPV